VAQEEPGLAEDAAFLELIDAGVDPGLAAYEGGIVVDQVAHSGSHGWETSAGRKTEKLTGEHITDPRNIERQKRLLGKIVRVSGGG
jgi:hypothetical protein